MSFTKMVHTYPIVYLLHFYDPGARYIYLLEKQEGTVGRGWTVDIA